MILAGVRKNFIQFTKRTSSLLINHVNPKTVLYYIERLTVWQLKLCGRLIKLTMGIYDKIT